MQLSDGMATFWVLAAGGGGSSGFGGGGGGGGGGSSFGGSSSSGGGEASGGSIIVVAIVMVLVFAVPAFLAWRKVRRDRAARAERAVVTGRAAAEAVEDDAHFGVEAVQARALELFVEVQRAWDAADRDVLRKLAGADLMREWELRLDDFAKKGWRNRVRVTHDPVINYVGLVNREDDNEDRVAVSIECELEDYVMAERGKIVHKDGEDSKEVRFCEYWTLAWSGTEWLVDSIQSEEEGAGVLEAPLVPSPWSDEGRLHDEAVIEGAVGSAAPAGSPKAGELVDVDYADDARVAALDLALVDGRYGPEVIEAAVRGVVPAWVAAVDGADDELLRLSTPEAVRELLYPRGGDAVRLVVRGAQVERVRITAFDAAADPPLMTAEVTYRGRRYLEDRSTAAVVEGSREREDEHVETLTLRLDASDPAVPWRAVGRGAVALG